MPKKSKTPAPITTDQTVSEVFQAILRHNYDYLVQWEQAARNWEDIEGVHQLRVSFRRIRSAFSAFRGAVPKDASAYWSEQARWLAGELGLARDLDVFIDEGLKPIGGLLPLLLFGGPMWESMCIAIMFGLIFSTGLTLGVVPVLYSLFFRVSFRE